MSALMAASTGDLKWEERYNKFAPDLDNAINELVNQFPNAQNGKQTDQANLKLVELETQSFQLIRQGKSVQALEILLSSAYNAQKQEYAKGISATLSSAQSEMEMSISSYRQSLLYSLTLAYFSFPMLIVTGTIISQKVQKYAKQRDQAIESLQALNHILEDRVDERTQELRSANLEINRLNEQLKQENLRMSTELEVTQRLQQMILPRDQEFQGIKDLDIAGFMQSATEVGGDYYDVLYQNGHIKIGIGDVTGHGIESSVLMIMVQTAFRTLVALQEEDLNLALTVLNTVLYYNVQRMNSDKNMTLLLMNYYQGKLSLVGQHEEVIIIRKKGAIERIDTIDLGFPLGLEPDISSFLMKIDINLEVGDVAVVYTDGITEAENPSRQFYGLDRLCEVIKKFSAESSKHIREAIIQDLREFISWSHVYDDITFVVLKRV